MGDQLNDDTVEHFLSGTRDSDDLGRLLGAIKSSFDAIDAPEPSAELRSFIDNATSAPAAATVPADEISIARKRRRRIAAVAVTGTTMGKLMIGVSAAAASVAGMHAAGLVDIPVLPDRRHPAESMAISDTTPASTTTSQEVIPPQPTTPAGIAYSFEANDAGTINIGATNSKIVTATADTGPGWKSQVSTTASTVDVTFKQASDRIDVQASLDHGLLHVIINDHRTGTTDEFWLDNDNNPTLPDQAPQQPEITPTPDSASTDNPDHNNDTATTTDDGGPDGGEPGDDQPDNDGSDDNQPDDNQPDDDGQPDGGERGDDQPDSDGSDDDQPADDDQPGDDQSDGDEPDDDQPDDDQPDDLGVDDGRSGGGELDDDQSDDDQPDESDDDSSD